jgi:hypothetical protein
VCRLGLFACLLLPAVAWGQLPPVGVPAGAVRVELEGSMDIYDTRWLNGHREPFASDLISATVGGNLLPHLDLADTLISRITGIPAYTSNLGALTADGQADVSRGFLGASLGLTKAITIFGRIPLVRSRVQTAIALDSTSGNVGENPGDVQEAAFFQGFDAGLTDLQARITAGAYDADPATRALAEATLADGASVRDDLFELMIDPATAAGFVPTASSAAGAAIAARIAALQSVLSGNLGVTSFTEAPVLPAERTTAAELLNYIGDFSGPVALRPGESTITFRGDAEAGAALTFIDHWDRGRRPGGFRAAFETLVRFPTGRVARTDRLLSLGTGDGQTDLEFRLTTDLAKGRWGARLEADYNRQFPANYSLRVAPPTQPFPSIDLLTVVRRDPGDIVSFTAHPFFRLAPSIALMGTVGHWSRQADEVSYASTSDEIPGVAASVLAEDTKANATVLGIGISYANPGARRPGGNGLPVDASWSYERVVSASGGIVPDAHRVRASFRAYIGLF